MRNEEGQENPLNGGKVYNKCKMQILTEAKIVADALAKKRRNIV